MKFQTGDFFFAGFFTARWAANAFVAGAFRPNAISSSSIDWSV
jgi:hypothetical protein